MLKFKLRSCIKCCSVNLSKEWPVKKFPWLDLLTIKAKRYVLLRSYVHDSYLKELAKYVSNDYFRSIGNCHRRESSIKILKIFQIWSVSLIILIAVFCEANTHNREQQKKYNTNLIKWLSYTTVIYKTASSVTIQGQIYEHGVRNMCLMITVRSRQTFRGMDAPLV